MFKKAMLGALAVLVLVVAAFCIFVAIQPDDFRVTRSTTINSPPERIFEQINDFHKWEAWSPWAKLDPGMKTTYSGPASGVGSAYVWAGDDRVGEGKMTIAASHPSEHVAIDLEFIKPFAAKNVIDLTIKQSGDSSEVTWSMSGKNNFFAKAFNVVMNMDKLVGPDFEKGLAQLKSVAESSTRQ